MPKIVYLCRENKNYIIYIVCHGTENACRILFHRTVSLRWFKCYTSYTDSVFVNIFFSYDFHDITQNFYD